MKRALASTVLLLVACGGDNTSGDLGPADFTGVALDLTGAPPPDMLGLPPAPPTTAVSVYVEPGSGITPVANAILAAKSSVSMEMYLLDQTTVINALTSAARAGVNVRVILDHSSMTTSNQSAYNTLGAGGVHVQWSSPQFTYTHVKSIVIDDKQLWAMTMNLTVSAPNGNREYLLVDTDPDDIAEAHSLFEADWNHTAASAYRLVVSPINARTRLQEIIDTAQSELDIEWEEFSDNQVALHVQSRLKAGVAVKIVVPTTIAGTATVGTMNALKAVGASIVTNSSPTIHAKLILVDHASGFIGSENATSNSLQSNREVGVYWQSAAVAAMTGAAFTTDFTGGKPF